MLKKEDKAVTCFKRNEMKKESGLYCGLPLLRSIRCDGSSTKKVGIRCWRAITYRSSALHPLPQLAFEQDTEHPTVREAGRLLANSADCSPALHPFPQLTLEPHTDDSPVNYGPVEANEDPLSSLLHDSSGTVFPCQKLNEKQKLSWLRSQLIGEHREFKTSFGTRRLVYADHTASGRCLHFIERFLQEHVLPSYGNTHSDDSYVGSYMGKMTLTAQEYLKNVMGGSDDDVLIMCGSGSTAAIKRLQEVMGVAVPSILRQDVLNSMSQNPAAQIERWVVFVGPYEHHSNLLSWRQSLAEVKEISSDGKEGYVDMEQLEEELRLARASGRKNLLGAFSACSNVTGLYTDTRAIARLLHSYGAFAFFDFAAGAPHMEIDMRSDKEDGYDAITISPHKFIGGPGTPGILLMRKSLYKLGKQPPSTCGGGTVQYVNGFNEEDTLYYESIEEREQGGTPPILGKIRCALAFWIKESMGTSLIRKREDMYMRKAMKSLCSHRNIKVLGDNKPNRAPIITFLIFSTETGDKGTTVLGKPLDGNFVVKLLNDLFGVQTRGGCACAGPYGHLLLGVDAELSLAVRDVIIKGYYGLKPSWTRFSLCYTMSDEEVEYILSAVCFLARVGQRFLPLYDLDWHTGSWKFSQRMFTCLVNHDQNNSQCNERMQVALPQSNEKYSERERFRRYLHAAKALCDLLPRSPVPRVHPANIDPSDVFFRV